MSADDTKSSGSASEPKPRRGRRPVGRVDELIRLVASGIPVDEAAEPSGMSVASAYRRLRDPEVQNRLREQRAAMHRASADLLGALSQRAVQVVGRVMTDTKASNADRLRAAGMILSHLGPTTEMASLREELDALRAEVERRTNSPLRLA